jgi:hypothetical protein
VLVLPGYPSLPSRDISVAPHHRRVLPRRCIVRIDEHGSKDRVKDASRSACNGVPCLRPVPTLILRRTTALPSLAFLRTSAVTGALSTRGGNRGYRIRADQGLRSNDTPRSVPPSGKPGCLLPPRHAKELFLGASFVAKGLLPQRLRAGSLAHATHTFSPGWGECFVGSCKCRGAVTRDPRRSTSMVVREYRHLFYPPSHAWD